GFQDDEINNNFKEGVLDKFPLNSDLNLDDTITGSGVDQDVRIYTNNKSENLNNNEEFFEIPSIPLKDMFLTYGDLNFTFQSNFTTEYILEDNDALYPLGDFIYYDFNPDENYSNITYTPGAQYNGGDWGDLVDVNNGSFIDLSNSTNGILNFTIAANFSNMNSNPYNVAFNKTHILGLLLSLVFDINEDANLTIKMKDIVNGWEDVANKHFINSSLGEQEIRYRFINENLNYIDLTNTILIQFVFERSDNTPYNIELKKFDFQSTYAFDLPITDTEYVALEFDLKGLKTTVNGFYAWIRTLDLVEAATTQLNITLYRANRTVERTDLNLRNINMGPDYDEIIDTKLVTNYIADELFYFELNKGNTANLNLSNYFIVIKSNNPKEVYSLVTLPFDEYGDDLRTEHQLKTTKDDGGLWKNAKKKIDSVYISRQLDASSFKLNVTRGFKPSDFNINNTQTLKIQDLPIVDVSIPYNGSSSLEWGKGRWHHNFTTSIEDNPTFQINLTWDKTNIKRFTFNVSYSVNAYWIENAATTYRASYDNDPEWVLTYYFNKNDPFFDKWNFLEFWFTYHNFLNAHNLTNPVPEEIFYKTEGQSILTENPEKSKVIVNKTFAILDGYYTLNLTSYNFIYKMHSYINFNDILWETNGFMYGDNITTRVDIQDHNSKAPLNGVSNVTLFYPNGTKFSTLPQDSSGIVKGASLIYDFDNETILELTNDLKIFGEYHLGFFWFNGSAIGCKKVITYIDTYYAQLDGCNYNPTLRKNVVFGQVDKVYHDFTLMIASINDTTIPNFYPINITNINRQFIYKIEGQKLPILLSSIKQSENILNPNEIVNIKASCKNLHYFLNASVKINVRLVSFANEEWIIAENTSSTFDLKFSGHPDDANEFDVNLKIPDLSPATNIWPGVNAPIRLAGAKTIITVFIEGSNTGKYESAHLSLLSNKSNNDYDGYILGLRINKTTAEPILNEFNRDECIYLPNKTSILVNIFDQNYVSSYNQFTGEFSLKLNSKFTDITINPNTPIKGQSINISAVLATEFGKPLANKNISCQYFEIDSWVNFRSDITNSNGFITFLINTLTIDFEGDLLIRLIWEGDTINGVSKTISVSVIHELNALSVSIIANNVFIYRNRATTLDIILNNIGDSDLKITNISIELNHDLSYSIVEIDYLLLSQLPPDENTRLIIEISIKNFNRFKINVSITAQNIFTNETIVVLKEASFKIYDIPIYDYILEYLVFIIGAVFALVWITIIIYALRIRKKLATPIEEVKKKPRRGRYVPVSELKKPIPVKKIPKKKEEPKEIEEKEKIDLDSLLEERGLAEKKKKPKK
ncbi:MAG: hypothetical protein ACFFC1_04645, partial [Promethearchaeota archaeon]